MTKKKVGIRLPRQVHSQTVEQRWAHELEALAPIADIVEIPADTQTSSPRARAPSTLSSPRGGSRSTSK